MQPGSDRNHLCYGMGLCVGLKGSDATRTDNVTIRLLAYHLVSAFLLPFLRVPHPVEPYTWKGGGGIECN